MKAKIKRKIRIQECTSLKEYTGFIFVSNKILVNENPYKEIKLNVTKLFTKNFSNNLFLEDKFVNKNIENHIVKKYEIEKPNILHVTKIYEKPKKTIYLVYLKFDTSFKNELTILNMYSFKNLQKYNDLYYYLFSNSKKNKNRSNFKMSFDSNNYLTIDIKNIYYYLSVNEQTNKDLKEILDI